MVFSSSLFLFLFLPITIVIYFLCININVKNIWLLLASLFFYSWGEPKYIFLMIASILVNYIVARFIDNTNNTVKRKIYLGISLVFNIGALMYFKYANFFLDNLTVLFNIKSSFLEIALPIGISFYTFQIMSYVIDVYRKNVEAQANILKLSLYISLFPQLIAGPIVRYVDIAKQIDNRECSLNNFYEGSRLFIFGLAKKVLIADTLSVLADAAFALENCPMLLAWLGIIAYTLQIYFDFSGYSDMARGIGRIFGFDFMQNFNYPYISKTPQEFWRRWHISLSTWFRDYVYIPLGGSRCSKARAYLNRSIVFFLTGFWHGASWNFIFWGLYHGFFLIIDQIIRKNGKRELPFGHFFTMLMVIIGWVFFRAENMSLAISYLGAMFSNPLDGLWLSLSYLNKELSFVLLAGFILSTPVYEKITKKMVSKKYFSICENVIVVILFVITLSYVVGVGFSPFLYFRF